MLPIELFQLCVAYNDEETCVSLAHVNKSCLRLLSTKPMLRHLFRAHKVGHLSLTQLQRGLHYLMYYRSTLVYTRNNIAIHNTYKVMNGRYMIDIFGRLYYRGGCIGKDFVDVYDLRGLVSSCITLDIHHTLVVRRHGFADRSIKQGSLTNIQSFTVRNGYLLCRVQGERHVQMYFIWSWPLQKVSYRFPDSIDLYPKKKVYPSYRLHSPHFALSEGGYLYRGWHKSNDQVTEVFFFGKDDIRCYYEKQGKYYQGYSLCPDIIHIQYLCNNPLLLKVTYLDKSVKIIGLEDYSRLHLFHLFPLETADYLYLSDADGSRVLMEYTK